MVPSSLTRTSSVVKQAHPPVHRALSGRSRSFVPGSGFGTELVERESSLAKAAGPERGRRGSSLYIYIYTLYRVHPQELASNVTC